MKALITGVNGQDGSYLSEILIDKGYEVHGVIRRSSVINTERIDHLFPPESKVNIHYGDLTEGLDNLIYQIQPDEIYNLGAMSHVKVSFEIPVYTADTNALGALRILEGIKRINPKIKYYQASSSEMFGTTQPPQNENSPFNPVSPYGIAKLFAYHTTRAYRNGYGIFASNGILFNHESPRRGHNFVTQKIVRSAVNIKLGLQDKLVLGNLDAVRDWGHSYDYMRAVNMILSHNKPGDYVVATGEYHTVREFLIKVFNMVGLDVEKHVVVDKSYYRPNEVPSLCGDATKIREELGWEPLYTFDMLVQEMITKQYEAHENTRG